MSNRDPFMSAGYRSGGRPGSNRWEKERNHDLIGMRTNRDVSWKEIALSLAVTAGSLGALCGVFWLLSRFAY